MYFAYSFVTLLLVKEFNPTARLMRYLNHDSLKYGFTTLVLTPRISELSFEPDVIIYRRLRLSDFLSSQSDKKQ